jgi:hypothetical protein
MTVQLETKLATVCRWTKATDSAFPQGVLVGPRNRSNGVWRHEMVSFVLLCKFNDRFG